jgi:type I restriction enzyme S subunit
MKLKPYPSYKDSGVEWLGKVPVHWEIWQSRRLFDQRKDRAFEGDEQLTASQKYGVIPQKEFMAREDQKVMQVLTNAEILKHVEPGDFVISMRSFQGGIEWCGYSGCVSSAYVPLIPTRNICSDYFRHLFKSCTYIQALQSTSNLVRDGQALRFENFVKVLLPKIPLGEQASIATFLDRETAKLDTLIAKQAKLIELLKEKRQAVIFHAVTKGLDSYVPMKDSGVMWLGEVPAHWEVKRVSHIADLITGFAFPSEKFQFDPESGIPLIRGDNVTEGSLRWGDKGRYWPSDVNFDPRYLLDANDIVIQMDGSKVGKNWALIGESDLPALLVQRVTRVRVKGAIPKFVYSLFANAIFSGYVEQVKTDPAIPHITMKNIGDYWIPLPPPEEQKSIIAHLDQETSKIDLLIKKAQRSIELAKEHRIALISHAVTGKIDVREVA